MNSPLGAEPLWYHFDRKINENEEGLRDCPDPASEKQANTAAAIMNVVTKVTFTCLAAAIIVSILSPEGSATKFVTIAVGIPILAAGGATVFALHTRKRRLRAGSGWPVPPEMKVIATETAKAHLLLDQGADRSNSTAHREMGNTEARRGLQQKWNQFLNALESAERERRKGNYERFEKNCRKAIESSVVLIGVAGHVSGQGADERPPGDPSQ